MKNRNVLIVFLGALTLHALPSLAQAAPDDACIQGYVWREAFPGDHVCVSPKTRAMAAMDNKYATFRRQPGGGAYGPDTCKKGFVWREANPDDHVCVSPQARALAAEDNRKANSRIRRHSRRSRVAHSSYNANERRILCPVSQVRAEITTRLPAPWWQTPQQGSVIGTDIMTIGGKTTLVCRYQAYGRSVSVMRELPRDMRSCRAVNNGFVCH